MRGKWEKSCMSHTQEDSLVPLLSISLRILPKSNGNPHFAYYCQWLCNYNWATGLCCDKASRWHSSDSVHSQYWYFIWEWRFHSRTAAMGFPFRDKITGGYPIKMKFTFSVRVDFKYTFQTRSKSHIFSLRMELPFRFILNFSECTTGYVNRKCIQCWQNIIKWLLRISLYK